MSTAAAKRLTSDDYYAITVEGDRRQLVEGEIIVNEPRFIHSRLQVRLSFSLEAWARGGEGRGVISLPTDVRLDEHNVYGPDLMWFSDATFRVAFPGGPDAYPERVPDLCVEIRSPGTWRYDVGAKKSVYERSGLPELWLVDDISETVLVFRRSGPDAKAFDVALELGRDDSLTSPQLPGFSLALEELFTG
jgi:Uma2 family endonuclease